MPHINKYFIILSIAIFISPVFPMKSSKRLSESQWQILNGSKQTNRALFAPWQKYKQLKREAPYTTDHSLKHGSYCFNYELVEHVEHDNIPMVQCLLELGAEVNVDSTFERWSAKIRRPITAAARIGNKAMCELLIAAGADVNAQEYVHVETSHDKSGKLTERKAVHYNALWQAVYQGHIEIVALLFECGIRNPEDNTIELPWRPEISLHKNYHAMRELLSGRGIEISMRSQRGQERDNTHLIDLVQHYEYEWVKQKIEHGADVNFSTKNYAYGNALIHAARNGWAGKKFVKLLLEHGADPNIVNSGQNTPLMHAVGEYDNGDTCRMLLDSGANQLLQNKNGHTALILAAAHMRGTSKKICPVPGEYICAVSK